jgi:hypothetical protein
MQQNEKSKIFTNWQWYSSFWRHPTIWKVCCCGSMFLLVLSNDWVTFSGILTLPLTKINWLFISWSVPSSLLLLFVLILFALFEAFLSVSSFLLWLEYFCWWNCWLWLLSDPLDGDVFVWIGISVAVVAVYCCYFIHLPHLSYSTMGLLSIWFNLWTFALSLLVFLLFILIVPCCELLWESIDSISPKIIILTVAFFCYLLHHPFATIILYLFILSDYRSFCFGALIYLFFLRIGILFICSVSYQPTILFPSFQRPFVCWEDLVPVAKLACPLPLCRPFGMRSVYLFPFHLLEYPYHFYCRVEVEG